MKFKSQPLSFENHEAKAVYMQQGANRDASKPLVLEWAKQFSPIVNDWERAEAILRFSQRCIDYVNDPGVEILDSASAALTRGFGDCDVKTRVFIALCKACGIDAKVLPVFRDRGRRFPHVLAAVFLNDQWWKADPTIVNSKIGIVPKRGAITNTWGKK